MAAWALRNRELRQPALGAEEQKRRCVTVYLNLDSGALRKETKTSPGGDELLPRRHSRRSSARRPAVRTVRRTGRAFHSRTNRGGVHCQAAAIHRWTLEPPDRGDREESSHFDNDDGFVRRLRAAVGGGYVPRDTLPLGTRPFPPPLLSPHSPSPGELSAGAGNRTLLQRRGYCEERWGSLSAHSLSCFRRWPSSTGRNL